MSSMPGLCSGRREGDLASRSRRSCRWNWPAEARVLLAAVVIAAALALALASRSVPEPGRKLCRLPICCST